MVKSSYSVKNRLSCSYEGREGRVVRETSESYIRLLSHENITKQKIILIAWVKHDERSALLGKHIGADVYFIQWGKRAWYMALLRYLVQTVMTWRILQREKPSVAIVEIPPIFAVPVVYYHHRLYGTKFVLDTHSGNFVSRIGRLTLGIHRFFSRAALVTLVPNRNLEQIVQEWDVPVLRLGYTPDNYPQGIPFTFKDGFRVVFICTFAIDEPVDAVLEAARLLPSVQIYITGNYRRAKHHLVGKPDNVTFTGYIAYEEFVGLLRGSDAILDLTIWESTVLMGGYEAISLQKPLITSNSETLREYFPIGTIHTDNTPEGIADGIKQAQLNIKELQGEIQKLHKQLLDEWDEQFTQFKHLIESE